MSYCQISFAAFSILLIVTIVIIVVCSQLKTVSAYILQTQSEPEIVSEIAYEIPYISQMKIDLFIQDLLSEQKNIVTL